MTDDEKITQAMRRSPTVSREFLAVNQKMTPERERLHETKTVPTARPRGISRHYVRRSTVNRDLVLAAMVSLSTVLGLLAGGLVATLLRWLPR